MDYPSIHLNQLTLITSSSLQLTRLHLDSKRKKSKVPFINQRSLQLIRIGNLDIVPFTSFPSNIVIQGNLKDEKKPIHAN